MNVGVIGLNFKVAPLFLRESLASFSLQELQHTQCVLLSTCNRIEIYFSADDLGAMHERIIEGLPNNLKQHLYSFFNKEAFLHLALTTCGLDSSIWGETEIQGQVKEAYKAASKQQRLSKELHTLFQKSLHIAKEVRARFHLERTSFLLEEEIFSIASSYLPTLPPPLIVGCSDINFKICTFLQRKGLSRFYFMNRTEEKAKLFQNHFSGEVLPFREINTQWHHFPWTIVASKSLHFLLTPSRNTHASPLLFDLALPRNIDPRVHATIYNIDNLHKRLNTKQNNKKKKTSLIASYIQNKIYSFENKIKIYA